MALETKKSICQYCNHSFTHEKTLATHKCEPKRRALARNEKHVVIGFNAFHTFFRLTQNSKTQKTYEEFAKSPLYTAFVKFGSYINNTKPIYPERFIEYVMTSGVKLDHWCRDEVYEKYLVELIKKESPETALERSMLSMQEWADENSSQWNHYFRYATNSRIIHDISSGKVSPWIILNSKGGKQFLNNLVDEELLYISAFLDAPTWLKKFQLLPADTELIRAVAKEYQL